MPVGICEKGNGGSLISVKGRLRAMRFNDLKTVLELVLLIVTVLTWLRTSINQYIDRRIDQKLRDLGYKPQKKNRCFSRKDKQR